MDDIYTEIMHSGVLGMKWGQHRERAKMNKMASKDAKRYAKAKMAYGDGAGVQRRHIKAELESKMKNPNYKKSFDDAMESINYAKATNQAVRWRKGQDTKVQVKRSTKATAKFITGTSSIAAAGIAYSMYKPQIDSFVVKSFKTIKTKFGG